MIEERHLRLIEVTFLIWGGHGRGQGGGRKLIEVV